MGGWRGAGGSSGGGGGGRAGGGGGWAADCTPIVSTKLLIAMPPAAGRCAGVCGFPGRVQALGGAGGRLQVRRGDAGGLGDAGLGLECHLRSAVQSQCQRGGVEPLPGGPPGSRSLYLPCGDSGTWAPWCAGAGGAAALRAWGGGKAGRWAARRGVQAAHRAAVRRLRGARGGLGHPPCQSPPLAPQVNVPKTKKAFCKGKECRKHTMHKVTQYKTGKASLYAQGVRAAGAAAARQLPRIHTASCAAGQGAGDHTAPWRLHCSSRQQGCHHALWRGLSLMCTAAVATAAQASGATTASSRATVARPSLCSTRRCELEQRGGA